ncbi:TIR domain-containing protein [Pseudoalteromonas sp. SWN166]|uniref:TIR domain-containing protein n=1 Tax=Pseudoalteromonas sp. SWN166 TaxID=2792061 RepID=UPI0018CE8FAF|nr:TIR domain-containing protein [Pseudoalteromonas sp. SWN166]MBH0039594.1 TIR domain-containing protein [Pseudoalteromonas sp. SWN166]
MAKEYKIFISHSWQYTDTLEALRNLINARGYFSATYEESTKDKPINSDDEGYVKRQLAKKIANSDVILALAGVYASHSSWMQWELDKAIELGIPVIGVIPRGQDRISTIVSTRSVVDIKWNTESIVSAIRAHAK